MSTGGRRFRRGFRIFNHYLVRLSHFSRGKDAIASRALPSALGRAIGAIPWKAGAMAKGVLTIRFRLLNQPQSDYRVVLECLRVLCVSIARD